MTGAVAAEPRTIAAMMRFILDTPLILALPLAQRARFIGSFSVTNL
jgi:hypothetical protein